MLGDNGEFYSSSPDRKAPGVKVADDIQKKVYQPHFDKIWQYYHHEFGLKIFELKTDLLTHFYKIYSPDIALSRVELQKHLAKNRSLYLRVKSFTHNGEAGHLSPQELIELEEFEAEHHKSYVFDDCKRNLEELEGIKKEYEDINDYLCQILFDPPTSKQKEVRLRSHLQVIEKEFRELVYALESRGDHEDSTNNTNGTTSL